MNQNSGKTVFQVFVCYRLQLVLLITPCFGHEFFLLQEAVEILDGKVLDLIKRSNNLTHKLRKKEERLQKLREAVKSSKWKSEDDIESETAVVRL